jgi:hypothetical protein
MAATPSEATCVAKPSNAVLAAPSNDIDLRSKIAAFSTEALADRLAKCLTDVTALNKELGAQLSGLMGELISSRGECSFLVGYLLA